MSFLILQLSQCDFTGAEVTSRAFPQDGRLILTAGITGALAPATRATASLCRPPRGPV